MDEQKIRQELINTLFAAFPREYGVSDTDIAKRKSVYLAMLQDLPTEAIRLACRKAYLEEDRLPSIAKLCKAVKSLMGDANEESRTKEWSEAWKEIVRQMYAMPYGKKPQWSTPEIEEAVESYGWIRLQVIQSDEMNTASAQIRRFYEDVCKRKQEANTNRYILDTADKLKALSNGANLSHRQLNVGNVCKDIPHDSSKQ